MDTGRKAGNDALIFKWTDTDTPLREVLALDCIAQATT